MVQDSTIFPSSQALLNKTFVLHGFGVTKKKELSSLISDHGGIVAFALGRNV